MVLRAIRSACTGGRKKGGKRVITPEGSTGVVVAVEKRGSFGSHDKAKEPLDVGYQGVEFMAATVGPKDDPFCPLLPVL